MVTVVGPCPPVTGGTGGYTIGGDVVTPTPQPPAVVGFGSIMGPVVTLHHILVQPLFPDELLPLEELFPDQLLPDEPLPEFDVAQVLLVVVTTEVGVVFVHSVQINVHTQFD